jgi:IclR family acetate operon transcriptional repressor
MPQTRKSPLKYPEAKHAPAKTLDRNDGQNRDRYFSRAVGKALEVLELLQFAPEPMALNAIASRILLSKTSTFRLLRTLEIGGALICNGSGQYRAVSQSGLPSHRLTSLLRVASPILYGLSRELGETVSLATLFENRIEVIAVFESSQLIKMSNVVGHIVPPYASSLGKAITAFQPEDRREKLLRSLGVYQYTSRTITDRARIALEFDAVAEQKFATDREETIGEGICFGVPIFSSKGEVSAAISTSLPKMRVRGSEHESTLIKALTGTAAEIAAGLAVR